MADPKDDDAPDRLAELLASVYGQNEADARDEVVQSALKRLEVTHRQAAMALRNFEHQGTVETNVKSGGQTPERRRKEHRNVEAPQSTTPSQKPSEEAAAPSKAAGARVPESVAQQENQTKPAAYAVTAPKAEPKASQPVEQGPKPAAARVVRVPLTHSRDPLDIHSGEGQSIEFD